MKPAFTKVVATPNLSLTVYAANDCIGKPFQFDKALDRTWTGTLAGLVVTDLDKVGPALDLVLWGNDPGDTGGDNNPFKIPPAAMSHLLGGISVAVNQWISALDNCFVSKADVNMPLRCSNDSCIWGQLVIRSGGTWKRADALRVSLFIMGTDN